MSTSLKRRRSICSPIPTTAAAVQDTPTPTLHLFTHKRQAGHTQQVQHARILSKGGWSKHFSLWVGGLPTVGSALPSRPAGPSLLI